MTARLSYTIRDGATYDEVAAACRAAMVALWDDLMWVEIDMEGLAEEPGCADAVAALQGLRLDLIGKAIGSTGLSRENARIVFSVNDAATSCLFDLTSEQYLTTTERMQSDGVECALIHWSRR